MVNVATFGNGRVVMKNYFSEALQVCLQGLCYILTPSLGTLSGHEQQSRFGLSAHV